MLFVRDGWQHFSYEDFCMHQSFSQRISGCLGESKQLIEGDTNRNICQLIQYIKEKWLE